MKHAPVDPNPEVFLRKVGDVRRMYKWMTTTEQWGKEE